MTMGEHCSVPKSATTCPCDFNGGWCTVRGEVRS